MAGTAARGCIVKRLCDKDDETHWGQILLITIEKLSSGHLDLPFHDQFVFVFQRNGDEKYSFQQKLPNIFKSSQAVAENSKV